MSSIPKRPRSSKRVEVKDRISALPDAILVHILSFLPTKFVVTTCIISPRWRNLWAAVPVLDFHVSNYRTKFVETVLLLHDVSSLSKFRLQHLSNVDLNLLSVWLVIVVKRRVQEIDLSISPVGCVYLPQSLCTSQTLVILRLGWAITIQLPTSVWFPSLKILEISVYHPDNNFIQKLLCSCPILENLNIEATLGEDEELVFTIVMPTLKRLAIYLNVFEHRQYHDHKITIDTPSLENITLCDAYLACYSVKTQTSLIKASVGIGQDWRQCDSRGMNLANRLYDIFEGLSTVKSLSLSLKILDRVGDYNLPMFYNLMHMDMHINNCKGWPQVLKLIKSMPNLEILELSIQSCHSEVDSSAGELISGASHEVPSCLLSRLKEMKVRNFDGCKEKMNLVKYLLKNSEVLQKVTIGFEEYFNLYKTKKKKPWKELLSCAKRSKTCQIFLIEEEDLSNSMLLSKL